MRSPSVGARGRRTWAQRLVLSFNILLVLLSLSAAAALGYGYEKAGSFPRVNLPPGVLVDAESSPGEAMNVLLVGTDASDGLDPDDPIMVGRPPTGNLADVIMVLRVDPETNDAALVSIPRDLWVPIAGTNQEGKINTSYSVGGPQALIGTIDEYLGIPINHFVSVDLAGFRDVVSAIGGVEVYFPYPARDDESGLFVPEAGCVLLDSHQALAYSRSRKYQNQIDGRWVRDYQDDYGRMRRQQEFMRRALSRAIERGARNPVTLNSLLNAVEGSVTLDPGLSTGQILEVAQAFRLFNPDSLGSYSLGDYVDERMIRGQAALVLREVDADPVLDAFRGRTDLAPTPGTVRVRVLNGSGRSNQAWEVAQDLDAAGFSLRGTNNLRGDPLTQTEVRYMPGQQAQAELLARFLIAPPKLVEDHTLSAAPVELVTGTDYRGLVDPADGPSPGTPGGSNGSSSSTTSTTSTSTSTTVTSPGTGAGGGSGGGSTATTSSLPPPCG